MASLLLPKAEETVLLRLCLWGRGTATLGVDGEVRERYQHWVEANAARYPVLLPMLARAREDAEIRLGKDLRTLARTAYFREQLRRDFVDSICGEAFRVLNNRGIPFVVIGGVALAEDAYADPALRHCHDCDLLVSSGDQGRAADALRERGFVPSGSSGHTGRAAVLAHPTGFPVVLQNRLLSGLKLGEPWPGPQPRRRPRLLCNTPVCVLPPEESLLRTCCRAMVGGRRNTLLWAADSWMIVHRADAIDWGEIVDGAQRAGAVVGIAALIGYVARELRAPVPRGALTELADAARKAGIGERQLVVRAIRGGPRRSAAAILSHARGWREYAAIGTLMARRLCRAGSPSPAD